MKNFAVAVAATLLSRRVHAPERRLSREIRIGCASFPFAISMSANVYSAGSSEEITGAALREFARRDEIVLATKVHGRMHQGANGAGLSRKAIFAEIDNSLRRLGTDYVDLYQIHRFDPNVPLEETLEALHDVVKSGKARYLGASSMYAWQFAKALFTQRQNGWTRFVSMQNHYNLLYREEEREMLPLCADQGVAVIPWSPLARGRLTRDWDAVTARTALLMGVSGKVQSESGVIHLIADTLWEPPMAFAAEGTSTRNFH